MKRLYVLFAFLFIAVFGVKAQEVAYTWARSIGGGTSSDIGYSLAVDAGGNVYLSGYYYGSVDFNPGAGDSILTSNTSSADIFLAKYTTDGNFLWARSFGGSGTDVSRSVAVDPSGNVYIAGYFYSTIDFDSGVGITNLVPVGSSDIFYAKYTSAGALVYAKSFGGTGAETLTDMDLPAADQIYLIGYYSGSMTVLVNGVNTVYSSAGSYDVFFGRFDNSGAYTLGAIGGIVGDYGYGIKGGSSIFITGHFYGTCDFNPSANPSAVPSIPMTSSGATSYSDAFIARYTLAANTPTYSWVRQIGGGVGAIAYDVSFNNVNNIYVTGQFSGTVDFNPAGTGVGAVPLTSVGGTDAFIAKYYYADGSIPNANYWAKGLGSGSTESGKGIYVDATSGNSYVSGTFSSTVDFDPGAGTSNLTSAGGYDVYIAKYSSDGSHLWSKNVGGTSSDYVIDAPFVDGSGNVYATGYFYGAADFDPSPTNTVTLTSLGSADIFFARYSALSTEPGNQPTALTFNTVKTNSISGSFTAAASAPEGYLVLRKDGSAPTFTPEDGTSYSIGTSLSDGSVVAYAGAATSFTASGLVQTTNYYFKVYSYNNNGLSYKINYNINSPLANNATTLTLAPEPTAQPSTINFSSITSNSMTVGWTAASPAPTGGYLVVRRSGSPTSSNPVDGTLYTPGSSTIGGGTVVYIGTGLSISETGLSPGDYHYKIYSFNGSGYTSNFLTSPAPPANNQGIEPSAQPTSANFTSLAQTSFHLNYTSAVGGASGYLIIRKVASSPTGTTPVDGTTYLAGDVFGDGTVAYVGSSVSSILQSGLIAGTEYYYDIYAYYGSGAGINYRTASPLEASQFTVFTQPSTQVTTVTFPNLTDTSIEGLITPTPENPTGYLVLYRQGGNITFDPVDGVNYTVGQSLGSSTFVASIGSGLSFIVSGLVAQNNYTFNVLPYNGNGNARNYRTNANNFSSGTLSAPPANQPTNISFGTVTTSAPYNIPISFTQSSGSPSANGYVVLRKSLAYTTATPKGGTTYASGNAISDAIVAYVGNNNNFTDTNLSPATEYYYSIFAYRGSGSDVNYKTIAPLQGFKLSGGVVIEPTTQPTSLVFSNISAGTFDVGFTAASGSPAGYVVLRKATVSILPATTPADGTFYSVGATINADAQVAYIGSSNFFSESLLSSNTYYYKVFSFNGSSTATNYFTGGTPLSGSVLTLDTQPANAPTGISFTSVTTNSFTVNYTAATGVPAANGYLAIRSTGTYPTSVPVDGTTYTLNATFGDGTIAYVGTASSFAQSPLVAANDYYYKIYSWRGGGGTWNYLTSSSLDGHQALLDVQPTQQPTSLVFSAVGSNSLAGSFSEPVSIPAGYVVIGNKSSSPTQLPVDGVAYSAGQTLAGGNYVAYSGTNLLFTDTNLDDASNYFYKVYAYNGSGTFTNYLTTSPLAGSMYTFAQEPTLPASALVFSNITVSSFDASFTLGGDAASYLVLRKKDSAPTGIPVDGLTYIANATIGDGTVVQVGASTAMSQTGLQEGANYFYSIYPFNGAAGTTNYLTANVLTGNQQTIQYVAPSLQPTGFTTSEVSASSFSVTFTPSVATDGYIVLRKTVSSPTSIPVNGTTYAVNGTLADGSTIVSVGVETTFLQTGLTGATTYFYDVFAYNGFGIYIKYKTISPLEGSGATLQTEPGGQPSNLLFTNITTTSFGVSFSAASSPPAANGYLVLRNDTEAPQFIPQDGVVYSTANSEQSDGSDVVQVGNVSTFTETNLSPGKKYYYKVFSFRGSGSTTNYLADFPLEGNQSTSQIQAPTSQPTSLSFSSITETGLQGSFTTASGGPGGYLVIRRSGSAPTGTPQNDNVYNLGDAIGDGVVVFFDNAASFSDAGLNPGTTYFYKIFSYNRDGGQVKVQLSSPLSGSQSTIATQPTDQPSALTFASVTTSSLDVSFTAASSLPAGYLILRKSGSVPTDVPVDGVNYTGGTSLGSSTIAFVGNALTFSESGLTAATNYFYSVFSFNGSGSSINYLTTTPLTSNIKTLASEPASQPTTLVFSALSPTSFIISFSPALGSPAGYLVLRNSTALPGEVPQDGLSYLAGNTLGTSTIVSVGNSSSFSESGLTPATVYFYKVFSFNGTSETTNYKSDNPLTGSQSTLPDFPSQATNLTFTSATGSSMTVNFTNGNGSSRVLLAKMGSVVNAVPANRTSYIANNAFGTGTQIGTGNFVVGVGSGPFTITALTAGSVYHFQVFEFNGISGLESYNTSTASGNPASFTIPLDTSKPLVTDKTNGTISNGNNINIVVALADAESGIATAKILFKAVSSIDFASVNLTLPTSGQDYTTTIPWNNSFDLGVEYKFDVTNGAGLKNDIVPLKTVRVNSVAGLTVPCNCTGTSEENYRIIAVPLELADKSVASVFEELMPFDGSKWRISHYENGDNKELTASSLIEPGKGYWLLVAESGKTFNTGPGNSVLAASDAQFSVDLKTGWNQIGNPYNYNLSWADVQAANNGFSGVKLRKYAGGWSDGTQLNKMEGAFIEASASQAKLVFPVAKNPSINGRSSDEISIPQSPLDGKNWQVYLNLEQGGWSSKISGIGMNEAALIGRDIFDGFAMPRMFKSYLEANHVKESSEVYSFDVVPTSENHVWELDIESNLTDDIRISWDNSYFGNNDRELYLFDVSLQLGIDMRGTNSYTIRKDVSKSFKVLFGQKDFIKDQTSVERLVLHAVSPNPAEGDVTFSLSLPGIQQEHNLDVEVVDLIGVKIWSYSNTMQSGFHKITWKRDKPETAGLYLVKVRAGSMTDAQKLIIIR